MRWLYAAPDGWPPVAAFGAPAKPPPPPNPAPMPDMEDPALLAAQKKLLEAPMARFGRLSTMLTDQSGYSGNKLGIS
jgi:hypothetical protein